MKKSFFVKIYSVGVWNLIFWDLYTDVPLVKIYSVGVWNGRILWPTPPLAPQLKFTPLEFETAEVANRVNTFGSLKFTPLEFETITRGIVDRSLKALKFTPLEFETCRIYLGWKLMDIG